MSDTCMTSEILWCMYLYILLKNTSEVQCRIPCIKHTAVSYYRLLSDPCHLES